MSLLPYKYPIEEQNFASRMMDVKAMCAYDELDNHPMTCKASLLPHLAQSENLNIDGMLEHEARLYIANASDIYGSKGTIASALRVLSSIGLHTDTHPAEIIEYRDVQTKLYSEFHNGTKLQDGTSLHNGGMSIYPFKLKWYQIKIILTVPASSRQVAIAYRLLKEVLPVRCEIVEVLTNIANYHDGTTFQNGMSNHGNWRA